MSDDAASELIREIAAAHGVALDRSDPILILQTATRKILQEALVQAQVAMSEAMAGHRSELELAASKWQADARRAASQLVQDVQATQKTLVSDELGEAAKAAARKLEQTFARHEKVLARSTLTCALAAAVIVLALGAFLWMTIRPAEDPGTQTRRAVSALQQPARTRIVVLGGLICS